MLFNVIRWCLLLQLSQCIYSKIPLIRPLVYKLPRIYATQICSPINIQNISPPPAYTPPEKMQSKIFSTHMLILIMTSQLQKLMEWFKRIEHDYSMKWKLFRSDQLSVEVKFDTNYVNDNKLSNKKVRIYW